MLNEQRSDRGYAVEKRSSRATRRSWLQSTGWMIAAGAFSRMTAWAAAEISPVMEKLSAYMAEARSRALPDTVVQETMHHILDTIAAMVSGSELAPGLKAIEFARAYGGEKIATVVASRVVCGPMEAAFANGMLAHSDETTTISPPEERIPAARWFPRRSLRRSSSASVGRISCAPWR